MNPALIHESAAVAGDLESARKEFQALTQGSGVYDLASGRRVLLTGTDRVRWLNGMVTNNIRDLAVGRGVYAFLLNPQGRILGDLCAYNCGGSLAVDTSQLQLAKILETLDRYIIMDDVEVVDVSGQSAVIGIAGPKSELTLRAAGFEIPALQPLQFATIKWNGNDVAVVRGDNPSVVSYELRVAAQDADTVKNSLVKAGAAPIGIVAQEWLRIASGIPLYGKDIREKDLPQETCQERALNFNKGCYIGQEIVERIRSRGAVHRQFTGFLIEGPLPESGTELQFEGKKAGEITSVASLPMDGDNRNVALGYVRREIAATKKALDGGSFQATAVMLPFSEFFQH
jgi:folate-binding protein YgfZ